MYCHKISQQIYSKRAQLLLTIFATMDSFIIFAVIAISKNKNINTTATTVFTALNYFIGVVGGALGDTLLGRFNSVIVGSCSSFIGLLLYVLSYADQSVLLSLAFTLLAFGNGANRTNVAILFGQQKRILYNAKSQDISFMADYTIYVTWSVHLVLGTAALLERYNQPNTSQFLTILSTLSFMVLCFMKPYLKLVSISPGRSFNVFRKKNAEIQLTINSTFVNSLRNVRIVKMARYRSLHRVIFKWLVWFTAVVMYYALYREGQKWFPDIRRNKTCQEILKDSGQIGIFNFQDQTNGFIFGHIVWLVLLCSKRFHYSPHSRLIAAIILMGLSYVVAAIVEHFRQYHLNDTVWNKGVVMPEIAILSFSQVLVYPAFYEIVYRFAPKQFKSIAMGGFLQSLGAGLVVGYGLEQLSLHINKQFYSESLPVFCSDMTTFFIGMAALSVMNLLLYLAFIKLQQYCPDKDDHILEESCSTMAETIIKSSIWHHTFPH